LLLALGLGALVVAGEGGAATAPGGKKVAAKAVKSPSRALTLLEAVRAAKANARELGVHIVRLSDGKSMAAEAADTPRTLASNTKLFTTAAVLDALGSDYKFETQVLTRGTVVDGELRGDVAILGAGDPNISGRSNGGDPFHVFRSWAQALGQRGISRIAGRLILVDGVFDDQSLHPDWPRDQSARWYMAPVGALSFSDNCVLVRVFPGRKAGDRARAELVPAIPEFPLSVSATTTASRKRNRIAVSRAADSDAIHVSGAVYVRGGPYEAWVTVRSPREYFAAGLRQAWRLAGIEIASGTEREAHLPAGIWERVTEYTSPLVATIEVTNKRSQNFYAESLIKLLGATAKGEGTWKAGSEAMGAFLDRVGLQRGSYSLVDGSGLSRGNRVAPAQVTQLLAFMYRHPSGKDYMRSLAYSGEPELSWARRLATPPYRGNVFAKTGTLNGVSSLSGYAKGKSGALYAFSILCNQTLSNWRAQRSEDDIVRALIDNG
jgi:D-alanyl-D-alanine carboxypeptidase/D-alanyl-D-alanine-endopeptidase (penicillin-binding protein 4)